MLLNLSLPSFLLYLLSPISNSFPSTKFTPPCPSPLFSHFLLRDKIFLSFSSFSASYIFSFLPFLPSTIFLFTFPYIPFPFIFRGKMFLSFSSFPHCLFSFLFTSLFPLFFLRYFTFPSFSPPSSLLSTSSLIFLSFFP